MSFAINEFPMQSYIPVVSQFGGGSALGYIQAASGLQTNEGVVQGFDGNNNILVWASGISGFTNIASGVYYGYQLEVASGDAIAFSNWPNNASDVKLGGHSSSTFVYPSGYLPNH